MDRLNELLQELGLSKVKLAKYLGVSRQMVYNYLVLDSLDKYADSSNLYDINIISTLGLTDDDITALQALDGVENAYGIQTKDSIS